MVKVSCNVNVDHPTRTVTIHGPDSTHGPDKNAKFKQNTSSGNFARDGGWFTGLPLEIAEKIASFYQKKGYKIKKYKF
ncbi:MAG: hypothetical protein ABDI07_10485 [Candidatus Kryptonium sp.]